MFRTRLWHDHERSDGRILKFGLESMDSCCWSSLQFAVDGDYRSRPPVIQTKHYTTMTGMCSRTTFTVCVWSTKVQDAARIADSYYFFYCTQIHDLISNKFSLSYDCSNVYVWLCRSAEASKCQARALACFASLSPNTRSSCIRRIRCTRLFFIFNVVKDASLSYRFYVPN